MGDPSIQPVRVSPAGIKAKGADFAKVERFARGERRSKLRSIGKFLESAKPIASKRMEPIATPQVMSALRRIVSDQRLSIIPRFSVFEVEESLEVHQAANPIWYYVGVTPEPRTQSRLADTWAHSLNERWVRRSKRVRRCYADLLKLWP